MEVTFLDVLARKSVRVRGNALIHMKTDPGFAPLVPQWANLWPDLAPRIGALVEISLEHSEMIYTPPYDDGATEAELVAAYKAKLAGM